ncbi:MAG: MlaD family protein [Chthoniobacterales bacterium]
MATENTKTRFQVGFFLLIGIIIAASMVVYFGRLGDGFQKYYHIRVEYPNASGLLRGAEVLLSGAKIGKVADGPHILKNMQGVYVDLKLIETAKIPDNAAFKIGSSGLLGDRFVEITMPVEQPDEKIVYIQPGGTVHGQAESGFGEIIQNSSEFVEELRSTVKNINTVVTRVNDELLEPKTIEEIKGAITDLKSTSEKLANSSEKIDGLVSKTSGQIDDIMTDAGKTLSEAQTLMVNANKSADSLKNTSLQLERMVSDVRKGKGTLGMLLTDDQAAANLRALIINLRRHGVLWYKDSSVKRP